MRLRSKLWAFALLFTVASATGWGHEQEQAQERRPSERVAEIVRLKQYVAEHPSDAAARVTLGNLLDDSGDSAAGVAQYREAIRVNPKYAPAYRNLALAHLRQGQWEAAESAAREAVRIEPKYTQARCDLATALGSQKDVEAAAREWRQAIGLDRGEVSRYWGFDRTEAEELARATPEAAAQLLVGLTLRRVSDYGRAVREIEKTVEMDRKFALAYLVLAQLYRELGRDKDRAVAYTKATALNPALEDLYKKSETERDSGTRSVAAANEQLGRYREMIPNLIRFQRASGAPAEQAGKARALLQEAAVRLRRLLGEMPENAEGYALLGDALRELEEPRAAWAYETAIRAALRGGQATFAGRAWLGLARLNAKAGREAAAMEMFSQGMLATPGDPELLCAAARLAAASQDPQARNPQKALEWAKKAVAATKEKDAACLSALAEAHFANGQLEAAVNAIQRAMALEPKEKPYREQFEKYEQAAGERRKK